MPASDGTLRDHRSAGGCPGHAYLYTISRGTKAYGLEVGDFILLHRDCDWRNLEARQLIAWFRHEPLSLASDNEEDHQADYPYGHQPAGRLDLSELHLKSLVGG